MLDCAALLRRKKVTVTFLENPVYAKIRACYNIVNLRKRVNELHTPSKRARNIEGGLRIKCNTA